MTKRILVILGLVFLLATGVQGSQEQLAESIKEARVETARAAEQLKTTLATLTALTSQEKGDLRPAFDTFTAEIPKTEAAAAGTRARVEWMAGNGQKYFEDWQKTIEGISNKSLQKKAQRRLDDVKKSYDKVEVSLRESAEKFKPFLSDLTDIQKLLSQDVTQAGVKSVRSTVSDANWRYKAVNATFRDALKEMEKMEKALSTESK